MCKAMSVMLEPSMVTMYKDSMHEAVEKQVRDVFVDYSQDVACWSKKFVKEKDDLYIQNKMAKLNTKKESNVKKRADVIATQKTKLEAQIKDQKQEIILMRIHLYALDQEGGNGKIKVQQPQEKLKLSLGS